MAKKNYALDMAKLLEANPAITAQELRDGAKVKVKSVSVVATIKRYLAAYESALSTGYAQRFSGNGHVSTATKITDEHRKKFADRCDQFEKLIDLFGGAPTGERGAKPFDMLNDI